MFWSEKWNDLLVQIIHRDLSAGNCLVCIRDRAKIGDIGNAVFGVRVQDKYNSKVCDVFEFLTYLYELLTYFRLILSQFKYCILRCKLFVQFLYGLISIRDRKLDRGRPKVWGSISPHSAGSVLCLHVLPRVGYLELRSPRLGSQLRKDLGGSHISRVRFHKRIIFFMT